MNFMDLKNSTLFWRHFLVACFVAVTFCRDGALDGSVAKKPVLGCLAVFALVAFILFGDDLSDWG